MSLNSEFNDRLVKLVGIRLRLRQHRLDFLDPWAWRRLYVKARTEQTVTTHLPVLNSCLGMDGFDLATVAIPRRTAGLQMMTPFGFHPFQVRGPLPGPLVRSPTGSPCAFVNIWNKPYGCPADGGDDGEFGPQGKSSLEGDDPVLSDGTELHQWHSTARYPAATPPQSSLLESLNL